MSSGHLITCIQGKTRQDKARQGKARQAKNTR